MVTTMNMAYIHLKTRKVVTTALLQYKAFHFHTSMIRGMINEQIKNIWIMPKNAMPAKCYPANVPRPVLNKSWLWNHPLPMMKALSD